MSLGFKYQKRQSEQGETSDSFTSQQQISQLAVETGPDSRPSRTLNQVNSYWTNQEKPIYLPQLDLKS